MHTCTDNYVRSTGNEVYKCIFLHPNTFTPVLTILYTGQNGVYKSIFLHPDTFTPVLTILYTGNRTENGVHKSIFLHPDMFTPLLTILYAGQGMECKKKYFPAPRHIHTCTNKSVCRTGNEMYKSIFLHPDTITTVLVNLYTQNRSGKDRNNSPSKSIQLNLK